MRGDMHVRRFIRGDSSIPASALTLCPSTARRDITNQPLFLLLPYLCLCPSTPFLCSTPYPFINAVGGYFSFTVGITDKKKRITRKRHMFPS
nr:hypothetical protein Q903MT_gene1978 [Picea sitchensis]